MDTYLIFEWICPNCGRSNGKAANICVHCNAPRPDEVRWRNVTAETWTYSDRKRQAKSEEQERQEDIIKAVILAVAAALCVLPLSITFVSGMLAKIPHKATSYSGWWQCDVYLEEYGLVRESGPVLPEGATLISTATSYTPDSNGNPIGEVETEYYYECEGWGEGRTVTTRGAPDTLPYYGEVQLAENEREASRSTIYYVVFTVGKESVTLPVSEHQYKQIEEVGYIKYTHNRQIMGANGYTILN